MPRPRNTTAIRLADASRIARHPKPDAVTAYDALTHDRVPANLGEPDEQWVPGIGTHTITRAEYDRRHPDPSTETET